jgi:hypothetical protein
MSNTPLLDPLLIPCLEWRRRAFEFSYRFEKWLRIPPSERSHFADELEELSREYSVLSELSHNLADQLVKRSWPLRIDSQPMIRYINILRRTYAERNHANDAVLLELATELTDYYVEDVLARLSAGPTKAVPVRQASLANDEGNTVGPVASEQHDLARVAEDEGDALHPIASKQDDAMRVTELKELGFVCMTQREMSDKFDVWAGGTNEEMAARARQCKQIRGVECHGGKLWVRAWEKMTPGSQDNTRPEGQT